MFCTLDHFVIAAGSLEEGAAWLEAKLGVSLSPGGQHIKMGTHNKLLRIGETTYLELIAIDPSLDAPSRPRWFGLDDAALSSRINNPTFLTWAVRTDDLNALTRRSPIPMGTVHPMSRGALSWLITIPDDGSLAVNGAYPFAIEWPGSQHPSQNLPHVGLSLQRFEIGVPDVTTFNAALKAISFEKGAANITVAEAAQPFFTLHLKTPRGIVELSSREPLLQNAVETGKTGGGETREP